MATRKTNNDKTRHLPQVYTVFKYILELGRHGLPNVAESADMVHRRRPWHNCITVSVAKDIKQAVNVGQKSGEIKQKEKKHTKPTD